MRDLVPFSRDPDIPTRYSMPKPRSLFLFSIRFTRPLLKISRQTTRGDWLMECSILYDIRGNLRPKYWCKVGNNTHIQLPEPAVSLMSGLAQSSGFKECFARIFLITSADDMRESSFRPAAAISMLFASHNAAKVTITPPTSCSGIPGSRA